MGNLQLVSISSHFWLVPYCMWHVYTCFRYSNVDLGKSRGCLQRGSHIRIQGFTRFVRDGVEDKWRSFGCSLMFYTFLSATCVNTWRLVVHCLTSVSKHIQKMNLWKMYLLLVLSLNDFQLKLRECGEAHEHPQELHFNDVHPGTMGIHETESLIRATLCLHFLWSYDSPICLESTRTIAFRRDDLNPYFNQHFSKKMMGWW